MPKPVPFRGHSSKSMEKDPVAGLLLRMADFLRHDVVCGLHSGFPPCCVVFYITRKRWMARDENTRYMDKIRRRERALGKRIQYVPCPECLRSGNIVRIRRCG